MKIIDAILLAAELFRKGEVPPAPAGLGPWAAGTPGGRGGGRSPAPASNPDDIYLDGMIYGSAVRSKYPRARVLAIHTEEAKACRAWWASIPLLTSPDRTRWAI